MKKFSKFLALSLACALTFSMTVLADESPDADGKNWAQAAVNTTAVNDSGETVEVAVSAPAKTTVSTVKDDIKQADSKLTAAVKAKAGFSKIADPELIFVLDITPAAKGTITVTIPFDGIKPAGTGEKYVLMHQNGDTWEPVSDVKVGDGTITFTSSSFSNYALFLVKDASDAGSKGSSSHSTSQTDAEPTSPKTGEGVPVAGLAALILLAGAALCAKKETA